MKTVQRNQNSLKSHGIQNSVKFGIKASGLAHIFNVLRNQLYSDKVMAVVREYTCNAVDAHIENGTPDRPIVVTMPTQLLPEFKVRDFGKALTDEEIQDVYAFYGESTKRQSNEMIGQLGLGSKSAFAYGDNFVINSYINGTKCIYNAFIDPSQIGQISKIGVEETDEENGIEIIVPVRENDHTEFEDKARVLFRYFPVRPIVKAANQRKFEYQNRTVLFSGENWNWSEANNEGRYQSSGDAIVVMGNIGYPIDQYALNFDRSDKLSNLLKENLTLTVPIGDLEISASREKLQYTDHTRNNLKRALKAVKDDLVASVSREFKDCKTLFDAKCLFGSIFDYGSPLYSLRDVLAKKLLWKGKPVDSDDYPVNSYGNAHEFPVLHGFKKSYRTDKYKCEELCRIECAKGTMVIENDIGHRRGILGRMLPLIINQGRKPFVIHFSSNKEKAAWKKKVAYDGPMTKLSSLPQHKLSEFAGYARATSDGSSAPKDAKHSAKCFTFDFKQEYNRWDRAKSQCWEIAQADMDAGGVYVIIDKFHLTGMGYDQEPRKMKSFKSACEAAGITFPKVYAFKLGQRNKVEGKTQWQSMWDYMKEQLKIQMEKTDLTQKYVDRTAAIEYIRTDAGDTQHLCKFLTEEKLGKDFIDRLADKSGTFATFVSALASMHGAKADTKAIDDIRQFAKDIGLEFTKDGKKNQKPTHDLGSLRNLMLKKYPMIAYLDYQYLCGWNCGEQKQFPPDLANYINVIDVCNQSPAE
jgi:hypothetical protein